MQAHLLLSSGEFARMCNVSRELLIYYDKIGLLKPKEVRGNGYRYYSLKQLYLFDVIRFFMDSGMPAKEIKDYLDNRTTALFLSSIQTSIDRLERQRELLDARIGMIEKMRYLTQRALSFPKDEPRLSFWDETWLLATEVERDHDPHTYAKAVSNHSDFCRNVAGMTTFPFGRIIDIPDLNNAEIFYYTHLITWISPLKQAPLQDRIMRKPKGNYAVILHQGGTSTVSQSYEKLLCYIKQEGFKMLGPIHEVDVNSYLMSDSADDYLLHISVLVDVQEAASAHEVDQMSG